MEPDIRHFLITIMQTISMSLLWLLINMTAGIYFDLGFFEGQPSWKNYVYYVLAIGSFLLLVRYIRRKWKGFKEITDV